LTVFLLTILTSYGQKPKTTKPNNSQLQLIDNLKKEVDQKWIRKNPVLVPTKSSFFNKENEKKYYVGLLQISGHSIPFTWDNNLSLLQFLLTLDNGLNVKHGIAADQNFKGTKISWNKIIKGLIWFNDKTYNATIDNWHLANFTYCPGTIIFPNLSFKKVVEIPNEITNDIQGLTIIPHNKNIKIKSMQTVIKTESGKSIKGIGYDLNNDSIFDIFSYYEEIYEDTGYTRLYINMDGKWKCKWVNLDEVCV
jgi:hypothetical protein